MIKHLEGVVQLFLRYEISRQPNYRSSIWMSLSYFEALKRKRSRGFIRIHDGFVALTSKGVSHAKEDRKDWD